MSPSPVRFGAEAFPIWNGNAPGTARSASDIPLSGGANPGSIKGVRVPTLTPVLPSRPNGSAAIVVPGGAYAMLVFEKEGMELAQWLCSRGITAFVLQYRLALEPHENAHLVALQDLQRAIRLIRLRSAEFGIDPARIGVIGASSGGHLAACAGTSFDRATYEGLDAVDSMSARPDFMVLLYGPYTGNRAFSHASRERLFFPETVKNRLYSEFPVHEQVRTETPPAFIATADNDNKVSPENGTALFLALRHAGVPVQLHIYDDGGHGFALRAPETASIAAWPDVCMNWLQAHGFIAAH